MDPTSVSSARRKTVVCRRLKPKDLTLEARNKQNAQFSASSKPFLDIVKLFCKSRSIAVQKKATETSDDEFGTFRVQTPTSTPRHRKKRKVWKTGRSRTHLTHQSTSQILSTPLKPRTKSQKKLSVAGSDTQVTSRTLPRPVSRTLIPSSSLKNDDATGDGIKPWFKYDDGKVQSALLNPHQKLIRKESTSQNVSASDGNTTDASPHLELASGRKTPRYCMRSSKVKNMKPGYGFRNRTKLKDLAALQRVRTTVALPLTPRIERERITMKYEQMAKTMAEHRQALLTAVSTDDDDGLATEFSASVKNALKKTLKQQKFQKLENGTQTEVINECVPRGKSNYDQPSSASSQHFVNDPTSCASSLVSSQTRNSTVTVTQMRQQNSQIPSYQHSCPQGYTESFNEEASLRSKASQINHLQSYYPLKKLKMVHRGIQTNEPVHSTSTKEYRAECPIPTDFAPESSQEENGFQQKVSRNKYNKENLVVWSSEIPECSKTDINFTSQGYKVTQMLPNSCTSLNSGNVPLPLTTVKELINRTPLLVKRLQELEASCKEFEPKPIHLKMNAYQNVPEKVDHELKCRENKPLKPRKTIENWIMRQQLEAVQNKRMPGYLNPTYSTIRRQKLTLIENLERSRILGRPSRYMSVTTSRSHQPFRSSHCKQIHHRTPKMQGRAVKRHSLKAHNEGRACRNLARRILSASNVNDFSSPGNTMGFDCSSNLCDCTSHESICPSIVGSYGLHKATSSIQYRPKSARHVQNFSRYHQAVSNSGRHKLSNSKNTGKKLTPGRGQRQVTYISPLSRRRLDSGGSIRKSPHTTSRQIPNRRLEKGNIQDYRQQLGLKNSCAGRSKKSLCYNSGNVDQVLSNIGSVQQLEENLLEFHKTGKATKGRQNHGNSNQIYQNRGICTCTKEQFGVKIRPSSSSRKHLGLSPRRRQPLNLKHNSSHKFDTNSGNKSRISSGSSHTSHLCREQEEERVRRAIQRSSRTHLNKVQATNSFLAGNQQQVTNHQEPSNTVLDSDHSTVRGSPSHSSMDASEDSHLAFSLNELAVLNAGDRKLREHMPSTTYGELTEDVENCTLVDKMMMALRAMVPTSLLKREDRKVNASCSNTQLLHTSQGLPHKNQKRRVSYKLSQTRFLR